MNIHGRNFSESETHFTVVRGMGYRIVRDWRCGVRRIRVFTDGLTKPVLLTKEQVAEAGIIIALKPRHTAVSKGRRG